MEIVDQIVSKLLDHERKPFTQRRLIDRCSMDIRFQGKAATREFYMRGQQGKGVRRTRRLFSNGPVGNIIWWEDKDREIYIEFRSMDLLLFFGAVSSLEHALFDFLSKNSGIKLDKKLSFEDIVKLRPLVCDVEIDDAILATLLKASEANSYIVICGLLNIDRVAKSKKWMCVDKNNWANKSFLFNKIDRPYFSSWKASA